MIHKHRLTELVELIFFSTLLSVIFVSISSAQPVLAGNQAESIIDPFLPLMPRKGDLSSIKKYGYLRIIYKQDLPDQYETELLNDFAEKNKLKVLYIPADKNADNEQLLRKGLADILVGGCETTKDLLSVEKLSKLPVSWCIHAEKSELRTALSQHLTSHLSSRQSKQTLAQAPKALRVVTRPNADNYFLKKGKPSGFEFELLQRFAEKQKRWLEVITVESEAEMLKYLQQDKADLATVSSLDHSDQDIDLSLPLYPADNFIITRRSENRFNKSEDINVVTLAVKNEKQQQESINQLFKSGYKFSVLNLDESLSNDEFLQAVLENDFSLALMPAKAYLKAKKYHHQLKIIAATNRQPLRRWAVNKNNPQLKDEINNFLGKEFGSEFFNIVYRRYHLDKNNETPFPKKISPYDHLVKKYAEEYKFDWRLVLAQMYQESQFKPNARSISGAQGLMQIMPATAKELRLSKVDNPSDSIKAGLKYMHILQKQYKDDLPENEKIWFTLASYNAGFERIQDARRFAKELGYNENRWFGHVELAMQQLADPANRKHTRFGFCNCGQTVVYVRKIRQLYTSYVQFTEPHILDKAGQNLLTGNVLDRASQHY